MNGRVQGSGVAQAQATSQLAPTILEFPWRAELYNGPLVRCGRITQEGEPDRRSKIAYLITYLWVSRAK